ncbi:hypothetical protein ES288_A03G098100v1 [Gossypium darwinii]|uniref:Uncharacterized protein n=2 Tax=Gossypium TaxID=3633 RepID=A0A5D2H2T6_GOSDA|nr:hypothetical protein ES288_A03G098100v1 [Gossypium darwinii]
MVVSLYPACSQTNLFKGRREKVYHEGEEPVNLTKDDCLESKQEIKLGETSCELQASHPWLPNKILIFMEDLSSISLIPCIPYIYIPKCTYIDKGRKTRTSMKEKNLSS